VLTSGSGLTTGNLLSAEDLVAVLRQVYRTPRRFPAFYGSFVVPRDASFAYLRAGNSDWLDRVALKTGSLAEPYSVNGIAGYLRRNDGGWMTFAVIVNGSERWRQIPHDQALRAMRADLERVLAAN
jgi:D-alanyl-D-alanine carboxypeptidase/D-alanyl-D-alanine-endopeptidase (penicillin-binding protein 4)